MGDFLLDFSVNTYEAFTVYVLIMALFRFPIRSHLSYAILASAIMAQSSYLMRLVFHLYSYTSLVMLLLFIVLFWLLFRVHPFYSLLMTVTGYLVYIVIQATLMLVLQIWFSLEEIVTPLIHVKMMQTGCASITLILALWVNQKRLGFSFVPEGSRIKLKLTSLNLMLLLVSIAASLLITGAANLFLSGGMLMSLIIALCLLTILIIMNLAYRREMADD
ncbi:hypothetical protein ACFPPD_14450 [Cohnella suwonensis]|uniref:Uncharacterized protein n=1 Tax=Cohnella suwonensis TaxID=696072 RepID=A0ABW0LX46_9BACL